MQLKHGRACHFYVRIHTFNYSVLWILQMYGYSMMDGNQDHGIKLHQVKHPFNICCLLIQSKYQLVLFRYNKAHARMNELLEVNFLDHLSGHRVRFLFLHPVLPLGAFLLQVIPQGLVLGGSRPYLL